MDKDIKINELIDSRYIERIYPSKEKLEQILKSSKKLAIYVGIDPTGPHLHLGHSTNLFLLKKFQELGHKIIFLMGDFTAQIGDPTGKLDIRKALTHKQILKNSKGYKKQVENILNFNSKNKVEIKFNSKWLSVLKLKDIINLTAKTTVGQMIKRDMFRGRMRNQKEIHLHEFLYPLLQGYDSVAMKIDIEIGGNDQTFNMMMGRDLVKEYLNREKFVIATKLLINKKTNKKLMSKSEGSFIALDEKPDQMYGKVMAFPDEVIGTVFTLCTEVPDKRLKEIEKNLKLKKINPRDIKASLAKEIVKIYYGEKSAQKAEQEFNKVFKEKKLPSEIKKVKINKKEIDVLELLVELKLAPSKSEAKRLIQQNAVRIDGNLKNDWKEIIGIKKGMVVKVGKRKFVKVN
ncbi:MAG: tyrosine--tRNA ligase [Candidatus Nealsonbacteria bacterium]